MRPTDQLMGTSRIETLIDGVFAIVMTLMVFGLKIPSDPSNLAKALISMWPVFIVYIMSFVVLAVYWVGHHNILNLIKYSDRIFLWMNMGFLLSISFVPFSTSLLGNYPSQVSLAVYCANLIIIGLLVYTTWWYSASKGLLVEKDLPKNAVDSVKWRILFGPSMCVVSLLASFISLKAAVLILFVIPIYYVIPGKIDRLIERIR